MRTKICQAPQMTKSTIKVVHTTISALSLLKPYDNFEEKRQTFRLLFTNKVAKFWFVPHTKLSYGSRICEI